MTPLVHRAAALAALLALVVPGTAHAQGPTEPEELLVRFRAGVESGERLETRRAAGADYVERLPLGGVQLVTVEEGRSARDVVAELERDPDVLYAEPNVRRSAFRVPTDPMWDALWALDNRGQTVGGRAEASTPTSTPRRRGT